MILALADAALIAFFGSWIRVLAAFFLIVLLSAMYVLYRCPVCGDHLDPRANLQKKPFCPACGEDIRRYDKTF